MAGNARLRMVADVIRGVFTGYDIYRYEQDEIVVFCKDIDKKSFMGLVRIVRESLDDLDFSVSTGFSWTDKPDIARQLSEVRLMYDIEKDAKLKSLDSIMRNKVFKDVVSEIKREASWCIISRRLIQEQASQSGRRPLSDFLMRLMAL